MLGLLGVARESDLDAIGLVVETNPQYPEPHGAKLLLDEGIGPLIEIGIDTEPLVAQADSIKSEREDLAERVREADRHEQSQTISVVMY